VKRDGIHADPKTLESFWLIGFAAWRAIETYAPLIVSSLMEEAALGKSWDSDDEIAKFEMNYKSLMRLSRSLVQTPNLEAFDWPTEIPRPTLDRARLENEQDKLIFDLVHIATSFAILHEIRHLKFIADGNCPADPREEEMICDVWARSFLTEKLGLYADAEGLRHEQVLTKRAMGLALAALILHEITSDTDRWGNKCYPTIWQRIQAIISDADPSADSRFWLYASCLLVGLFRAEHRPLDVEFTNYRELAEGLISQSV
jgi:hypothetical protein